MSLHTVKPPIAAHLQRKQQNACSQAECGQQHSEREKYRTFPQHALCPGTTPRPICQGGFMLVQRASDVPGKRTGLVGSGGKRRAAKRPTTMLVAGRKRSIGTPFFDVAHFGAIYPTKRARSVQSARLLPRLILLLRLRAGRLGRLGRPIRLLSLRRLGRLLTRVLAAHTQWFSNMVSGGVLLAPASPEIRQGNKQRCSNMCGRAAVERRHANRGLPLRVRNGI